MKPSVTPSQKTSAQLLPVYVRMYVCLMSLGTNWGATDKVLLMQTQSILLLRE